MRGLFSAAALVVFCLANPARADLRTVEFEASDIGLAIPDNGGPIADFAFDLPDRGLIYDMTIELQVEHTYIGDLQIKLVGPEGDEVILHDRTGGSDEDINTVYTSAMVDFEPLKDRPITGEWHLIIDDMAGGDVGTLQLIRLTIERI